MNDIHKIADKIESHVIGERKVNAANRAIGGGKILLNNKEENIWILNREIKSTSTIQRDITGEIRGTAKGATVEVFNDGGISTSKNSYWGRTLLDNFAGSFSYIGRDNKKLNYMICNSYTYEAYNNEIRNIRLGSSEIGAFMIFKFLKDLRNRYDNLNKKIEEEKANLFNRKKLNSVVLKNERIKGEENIAIFNNMIHKENVMKRIVIQCEDIKVREAVSKALV